jgi:hypothetical protein
MKELLDKITVPANTVDRDDNFVPLLEQPPMMQVGTTYSVVELPKPGPHQDINPDQPRETEEANIRIVSGPGVTTN